MIRLAFLGLLLLSACAESPTLKCDLLRKKDGSADVSPELFAIATEDISSEVQEIRRRLLSDPSLVGLQGALARQFAATDASHFAIAVNRLRSDIAQQKARELALINNGDTLLGTKQEWQCRTLADSVTSLDLGQSSDQIKKNLDLIESHFLRMSEILKRKSSK